jgi:hypothetical protein
MLLFSAFFAEFEPLKNEIDNAVDVFLADGSSKQICIAAFKLAKKIRQKCLSSKIYCRHNYKSYTEDQVPFLRIALNEYHDAFDSKSDWKADAIQKRVDAAEMLSRAAYYALNECI